MVDGLTAKIARSHKPTIGREFANMSLPELMMADLQAKGERPASLRQAISMSVGQHTRRTSP